MGTFLEKLLDIGGNSLSPLKPTAMDVAKAWLPDEAVAGLLDFLEKKNGFYAFESALHFFPARSHYAEIGLREWNDSDLWVHEYQDMADGCLFFAEDIFGGQFCLKSDGVYLFDPETAETTSLASDIERWAELILNDYEVLTGYPLAHEWQLANGKLTTGMRLVPKVPFVLGGRFAVDNLYPLDSVGAMRLRASLATQIRDLPDGAQIKWKMVD
ncbi:SMI1/KNR4 family protein [Ralstonia solanacearum]|uniref:SMI1/KNR4 family protein n=1 Tax=Ralstonia solanacearum TaxID=305 RepID=UPI000AA3766C|nr:SMI1/KNR4 family protein [Ralstonia solanacearum]